MAIFGIGEKNIPGISECGRIRIGNNTKILLTQYVIIILN